MRESNKKDFYEPQLPQRLHQSAVEHKAKHRDERFFNQPGLSYLREAYVIGQAAAIIQAKAAYLSRSDPPDGFIRIESEDIAVEVCEALKPGRRRGQEYKDIAAGRRARVQYVDEDDLTNDPSDFAALVAQTISDKQNRYNERQLPKPLWLLIHLSWLRMFVSVQDQTRAYANILNNSHPPFDTVLVLEGDVLFGPRWLLGEDGWRRSESGA